MRRIFDFAIHGYWKIIKESKVLRQICNCFNRKASPNFFMSRLAKKSNLGDRSNCQICGEGMAVRGLKTEVLTYRARQGLVDLHISACSFCGSETIDEAQSILNRRAVLRYKKVVDRVPLGEEIRRMRKSLRLTQAEAGAIFGGGPVAFSKYENDDLMPDDAMSNLLRLAINDESIVAKMRALKVSQVDSSITVNRPVYHSVGSSINEENSWSSYDEFEDMVGQPLMSPHISSQMNVPFDIDRETSWTMIH